MQNQESSIIRILKLRESVLCLSTLHITKLHITLIIHPIYDILGNIYRGFHIVFTNFFIIFIYIYIIEATDYLASDSPIDDDSLDSALNKILFYFFIIFCVNHYILRLIVFSISMLFIHFDILNTKLLLV